MIYEFLLILFIEFIIGMLFGFLKGYSEKAFFFIIVSVLVVFVIGSLIYGNFSYDPISYKEVIKVIFFLLGLGSGEWIYENIFEN